MTCFLPCTAQRITRDLQIVFFRSNRIGRPIRFRIESSNRIGRIFNLSVFCICDEREWCTDYGTLNCVLVYFNSVVKRVKQCCCTLILLPKLTLNANLTTNNRFFTNADWQRGRFENFESDHQYESNLESDVRFEIESNHKASQVPTYYCTQESRMCYLQFFAF